MPHRDPFSFSRGVFSPLRYADWADPMAAAEQATSHLRAGVQQIHDVVDAAAKAVVAASSTSLKGSAELTSGFLDLTRDSANSALALTHALLDSRSIDQVVTAVTDHGRRHFELVAGCSRDLAAVGSRIVTEAMTPISNAVAATART